MFVAIQATSPCVLCGYRVEMFMMGKATVNKRSLRVSGPLLGAVRYTRCPECGSDVRSHGLVPRSAYYLTPEDAVKVAEYRKRRWGVESEVGELVEVREAPRKKAA